MNYEDELENKIEKFERSFNELTIRFENQNKLVNDLLEELNVTPEQLSEFIKKKENFTEENWEELEKQTKLLEQRLLLELANISNPTKRKKTYAERNIQPHWLFVR